MNNGKLWLEENVGSYCNRHKSLLAVRMTPAGDFYALINVVLDFYGQPYRELFRFDYCRD
jgi:hypothetical protein